ncbi:hypothetical protein Tco_1227047 [Tanacetum coccineum]
MKNLHQKIFCKNEIDRLLEASLTSKIQNYVLLSVEQQKRELLKVELEKSESDSRDIQANLLKRIKILENDFQRSQAQSIDFELKLQHQKEKMDCDVSWKAKLSTLHDENVLLKHQVESTVKERENIKLEFQKLFNSIKATRAQHQNEINEMFEDVTQKTYAYADVRAQNQDLLMTISELKSKLKTIDKGKHVNTKFDKSETLGQLLCVTPFNKNLAIKAKNVSNTKVTSDRSNPVTSQSTPTIEKKQQHNANVIARGMYKINQEDTKTPDSKANTNVSNSTGVGSSNSVRRPKSKDNKSKNNVLKNTKSSSTYVLKTTNSVCLDSNKCETKPSNGCSKHMTGNLQLLRNFVEKFMGIVCFGNDHFAAITGYGYYITILKTNMPHPSRRYGISVPALTKDHKRNEDQYAVSRDHQYAVKMDDPNITIEEYIRLEEEKARWRAIVFNDTLTSEATLLCEPMVSSLNNDEINFRISFDKSDDEDCMVIFDKNSFSYKIIYVNNLKTDSENDNDKVNMPLLPLPEPTVSCFDNLDFFKDFENEFPAIVYNDAQTSKLDFLTEPTLSPQHIDEFDLKSETSLSECDKEEENVLYFNGLFRFNVIYLDDSKSDKDNDDDKIDIKQSSGVIMEYLVKDSKRRAFWSLNEYILKITILKTNTPYPSRKIWCLRACTHQRPQRNEAQYAVRHIEDIVCEYSGRYQTWSLLKETPIRRIEPTSTP